MTGDLFMETSFGRSKRSFYHPGPGLSRKSLDRELARTPG